MDLHLAVAYKNVYFLRQSDQVNTIGLVDSAYIPIEKTEEEEEAAAASAFVFRGLPI